MADTYRRGTRALIRLTAVLVARIHDLPRIGSHIGGGRHVDMPSEFTLQTRNPGWTSLPYRLARRLHPTNDDWGCLIANASKLLFAIQEIRDARMTPTQQAAFQNAIDASLAIDATWTGAADIDDDPLQQAD